jgi:hypothetical protein
MNGDVMTGRKKRALLLVCLMAAVALATAIGYAGHTEPVKAGSRLASAAGPSSSPIDFVGSRTGIACPTVHGNLFGEPAPPARTTAPRRPVKQVIATAPPEPQPPPNPLAEYRFTGVIGEGDSATALVEHGKTKEGHYLRAGDPFLGGTVAAVSLSEVSLQVGQNTHALRRYDRYSLVPLDKDAPVGPADKPAAVVSALNNANSSYLLSVDTGASIANWSLKTLGGELNYSSAVSFLLYNNLSDPEEMNRRFEGR